MFFSLFVVAIVNCFVYDVLCDVFSGEWAVSIISSITIIFLLSSLVAVILLCDFTIVPILFIQL